MYQRIDDFAGSEAEYMAFLESTINSLRQHSHRCRCNSSSDATVPDPKPHHVPAWKIKVKSLVRSTPKSVAWRDKFYSTGLYDFMVNGQITALLLEGNQETPVRELFVKRKTRPEAFGDQLLERITKYAEHTAARHLTAGLSILLANFQKILVLSACAVLWNTWQAKATEDDRQDILEIVKICVGDKSDKYCKRLLRAVVMLNEIVDRLSFSGWGDRASELLLLWNRPVAYYHALACTPDASISLIVQELSGREYTSVDTSMPSWTPLFIPSLVHNILGKELHVARISHALNYKNAHILEDEDDAIRINAFEYFNRLL